MAVRVELWWELLRRHAVSGMTVVSFCERERVSTASFYNWRRRLAAKVPQPIEKGLPGLGLLAQVVLSKYGDHTPLYRQEDIDCPGTGRSASSSCLLARQDNPIHPRIQ